MKKNKWRGTKPTRCNLCGRGLEDIFIDGATKDGPWAIMCNYCHLTHGSKVSYTKYDLNTLEKIEN